MKKQLLLVFAVSTFFVHVMAQKAGTKKEPAAPAKAEMVEFSPSTLIKDGDVPPPPPPPKPPRAPKASKKSIYLKPQRQK